MSRKISDRRRRLPYVSSSRNIRKEMEIIPPNDDMDMLQAKKVRKEFSDSVLRKNSEHFEKEGDHLYSKCRNVGDPQEQTFDGSRRGRITGTSLNPRNEDFDEDACERTSLPGNSSAKRAKCISKNAIMARVNRMKKKQYVSSLENSNKELHEQNCELKQNARKQEKTIAALQHEITYLKSLLANSKEISEILRNLKNSTGLPVTSSLQSVVSKDDSNEQYEAFKTVYNERQAHVKRVTAGSSFPILQDDINLGNYALNNSNLDEYECNINEESSFSFSCESDHSLDSILNNEDNFDFNSSMFNCLFDKGFETGGDCTEESSLKTPNLTEVKSDVGLCLHINKRKISVELCSICNAKAQSQQTEPRGCLQSEIQE